MRNLAKKLSAIALCAAFTTVQVSANTIMTGDTQLGVGNGGAVIKDYTGGYTGTDLGKNSATLNFNGNAHVNWDTLNVNANETLNFNAVNGVTGITVLNTVNQGMTNVYGAINSNEGIAKLIISNPNGMLFDGAKFTTAGDLDLTQALKANFIEGKLQLDAVGIDSPATGGITIKNITKDSFNVGGEFSITAPTIQIIQSAIEAKKGMKLVTADGQNFLVCPDSSNDEYHEAVRMESVSIDGDVFIVSSKDLINFVNGGTINGSLSIESDGNVSLNSGILIGEDKTVTFPYDASTPKLTINGNLDAKNDGRISYLRNSKVKGNVNMSNSGGFLEVSDIDVTGNVDLKTTVATNEGVKHFVHVVGHNEIGGNLNIDSIHNIHLGGYDSELTNLQKGNLTVGGDLNATAHEGSIAVIVDTTAKNANLTSGTLNIISDGKATLKADNYNFNAQHYIGGVDTQSALISAMENYEPLPTVYKETYFNIEGGNVNSVQMPNDGLAFIRSNKSMDINNINSGLVYLSAGQDIKIGANANASVINVNGETRNLTVELPKRNYTLNYTNIKDTEVINIKPNEEITYEMANGENGWNKGTQTPENTYLVVPGEPEVPPVTPEEPITPVNPDPEGPTRDDAEKILKNLNRDEVASAIDRQQVYTPVAFAADLDEEIDTGVRKNVDGSVTVVRPFTPNK